MAAKVIPVLGPNGFAKGAKEKLSLAFAHMFESREADSNLFEGSVVSMKYLVAEYGNNPSVFTTELQRALSGYFRRLFDSAKVTVRDVNSDSEARFTVSIDVTVTQDNVTYSLGQEIFVDPLAVAARIIKEINR